MKKALRKVVPLMFLLLILAACGGGGGGGTSSDSVSPDPVPPGPVPSGTLYADDSVLDTKMFARISGTTMNACVFDSITHGVYTGTTTILGDKTYSIGFQRYPTGATTSYSASGVVDATGGLIPTTLRTWHIQNTNLRLPENAYAGIYYGSNTIDGVSGTFVAAISGTGSMYWFFGSGTGGWTSHQEFLGLFENAFSFSMGTISSSGTITLNGSASETGITGTWRNSTTNQSGSINVPKITCGGGDVITPPSSYTLTVNAANGTVTKNPNHTSYATGTTIQLTATANSGYAFTGWSGDITGTANPVTVTMNSNKTITANFTLQGSLPTVTTNAALLLTATGATLSGDANPNGLATTMWFEWGTNSTLSTYSSTATLSAGSGIASVAATSQLSGLLAGTTYYFRVAANNASGTSRGTILSFTTTGADAAPTVATLVATSITATGATLNGNVTPNGLATTAWFEWGTNSTLSTYSSTPTQSVGSGTTVQLVTNGLSGLSSGTTYYHRIAASNTSGTNKGGIASFTHNPTYVGTYSGTWHNTLFNQTGSLEVIITGYSTTTITGTTIAPTGGGTASFTSGYIAGNVFHAMAGTLSNGALMDGTFTSNRLTLSGTYQSYPTSDGYGTFTVTKQ